MTTVDTCKIDIHVIGIDWCESRSVRGIRLLPYMNERQPMSKARPFDMPPNSCRAAGLRRREESTSDFPSGTMFIPPLSNR